MHDITKADSENAKKRLIAMCDPRYLSCQNGILTILVQWKHGI